MARATPGNARLGCARVRRTRRRVGAALDRRFRSVNERVESVGSRVDTLAAAGARLETLEETSRSSSSGTPPSPEVGTAVEALGDPRVHFLNLPHRIPDPDPYRHWLIGSVGARNAGDELARGAWLTNFDDDDHSRPNAIGRNLALARERRLEVAYGPLVHGGLSFFERTPAAAIFDFPNDWFRIEAMLRAGVRFGMHDEIVFDCFPFLRGHPELKRTEGHAPAPVLRPTRGITPLSRPLLDNMESSSHAYVPCARPLSVRCCTRGSYSHTEGDTRHAE